GDDSFTDERRPDFFAVDALVSVSSGLFSPRASASVHPSRIADVLLRTARKAFFNSQARSSAQSAHRRYCVTLTQESRASGPSISRTTSPNEMSPALCASWYPPLRPR